MANTNQGTIMTKEQWDAFIKGEVLNFMMANSLQKLNVDDGAGKKGVVRRNAQGEYIVQITSKETM